MVLQAEKYHVVKRTNSIEQKAAMLSFCPELARVCTIGDMMQPTELPFTEYFSRLPHCQVHTFRYVGRSLSELTGQLHVRW